jgi:prepilin-type N-terminal cleavage/methylation domain-containing protein/prepilin-type processing-associated H-X9-DG protein
MNCCLQKASSPCGRRCKAFTLIELLVVVAVIGVLTATILPALSKAKQRTVQTHCMSNLKQIGIALQLYINDYDETLPGPVWSGVMSSYDKSSQLELIYYLADFLDAQDPKTVQLGRPVIAEVFVCPGYQRYAPDANSMRGRKPYILNDNINPDGEPRVRPFGYPELDDPPTPMVAPLKVSEMETFGNVSDTFAMTDFDQLYPGFDPSKPSNSDYVAKTPRKPVHGEVRNYLYFDGHVAPKPINW